MAKRCVIAVTIVIYRDICNRTPSLTTLKSRLRSLIVFGILPPSMGATGGVGHLLPLHYVPTYQPRNLPRVLTPAIVFDDSFCIVNHLIQRYFVLSGVFLIIGY